MFFAAFYYSDIVQVRPIRECDLDVCGAFGVVVGRVPCRRGHVSPAAGDAVAVDRTGGFVHLPRLRQAVLRADCDRQLLPALVFVDVEAPNLQHDSLARLCDDRLLVADLPAVLLQRRVAGLRCQRPVVGCPAQGDDLAPGAAGERRVRCRHGRLDEGRLGDRLADYRVLQGVGRGSRFAVVVRVGEVPSGEDHVGLAARVRRHVAGPLDACAVRHVRVRLQRLAVRFPGDAVLSDLFAIQGRDVSAAGDVGDRPGPAREGVDIPGRTLQRRHVDLVVGVVVGVVAGRAVGQDLPEQFLAAFAVVVHAVDKVQRHAGHVIGDFQIRECPLDLRQHVAVHGLDMYPACDDRRAAGCGVVLVDTLAGHQALQVGRVVLYPVDVCQAGELQARTLRQDRLQVHPWAVLDPQRVHAAEVLAREVGQIVLADHRQLLDCRQVQLLQIAACRQRDRRQRRPLRVDFPDIFAAGQVQDVGQGRQSTHVDDLHAGISADGHGLAVCVFVALQLRPQDQAFQVCRH